MPNHSYKLGDLWTYDDLNGDQFWKKKESNIFTCYQFFVQTDRNILSLILFQMKYKTNTSDPSMIVDRWSYLNLFICYAFKFIIYFISSSKAPIINDSYSK